MSDEDDRIQLQDVMLSTQPLMIGTCRAITPASPMMWKSSALVTQLLRVQIPGPHRLKASSGFSATVDEPTASNGIR